MLFIHIFRKRFISSYNTVHMVMEGQMLGKFPQDDANSTVIVWFGSTVLPLTLPNVFTVHIHRKRWSPAESPWMYVFCMQR